MNSDKKTSMKSFMTSLSPGMFPEPLELEPFLALEPPMSATDYGFSLDHHEGLAELFDFEF